MMKKICCIIVASFLVISMTIPMVFAGVQSSETKEVVEDTSSVELERSIAPNFVYQPGVFTIGTSYYSYEYYMSFSGYMYFYISDIPSSFLAFDSRPAGQSSRTIQITNNPELEYGLEFVCDTDMSYYITGSPVVNVSAGTLVTLDSFGVIILTIPAQASCCVHITPDPQVALLTPVYQLLYHSGVNEEWASIGVVIFAMLPIVTLWLIIGRVFKRKER